MRENPVVIVGAGHAGARAVESLRNSGWDSAIHLISSEPPGPYDRTAVSKAILFAPLSESGAHSLWTEATFAALDVDLHSKVTVVEIDRGAHSVLLSDGVRLSYSHLLLACGSEPLRLPIARPDASGIFYLRTLEDALKLRAGLEDASRLVVVGGGLIGLEVAAGATEAGRSVTVLEASPRILSRAVPRHVAQAVMEMHLSCNVDVRLDSVVESVEGRFGDLRVTLRSGKPITCQAVLVATGARPRIALAEAAGLATDSGIVVDERLVTGDPNVLACGDVASFPHPTFGVRMRLESWQNAEDQGRHAGLYITGHREPYSAVPWFWSDQFGRVLHVAGVPSLGTRSICRPTAEKDVIEFALNAHDELVAVSAFGEPGRVGRVIGIGRRLIAAKASPAAARLADPAVDMVGFLNRP